MVTMRLPSDVHEIKRTFRRPKFNLTISLAKADRLRGLNNLDGRFSCSATERLENDGYASIVTTGDLRKLDIIGTF